jgi:hypothetical protein
VKPPIILATTLGVLFGIGILFFVFTAREEVVSVFSGPQPQARFWQVQSIDTMKYSRDASRSPMSQEQIDKVVKNIADTGATHVAIDTPYDEEFLPRQKQWVEAARKFGLSVWFRGNWSAWEGWFGQKKDQTREQHLKLTKAFILNNPELFEDGDIFTACPECENGSSGDPRMNGDLVGFRAFMITEQQAVTDAFTQIHKKVIVNFTSMNGDVARLTMNPETTTKTGGVVSIDHYVASPQKLLADAESIAKQSGGKIVLGEFGAPIPDIHGNMTEEQQAAWIRELLSSALNHPEIIGMNYWVDRGGSTLLWNDDGSERKAVAVLREFYKPSMIAGQVTTVWGRPISSATVEYLGKTFTTDKQGRFAFPFIGSQVGEAKVTAKGFEETLVPKSDVENGRKNKEVVSIQLARSDETLSDVLGDLIIRYLPERKQ